MKQASCIRLHHENQRDTSILCHPSNKEVWKEFGQIHPRFAVDPQNLRLRLCSEKSLYLVTTLPYIHIGQQLSLLTICL